YNQPIYWFEQTSDLPPQPRGFIERGSVWHFFDQGEALPPNWTTPGYDDSAWAEGPAPLGYGGGERTTVAYGDEFLKFTTTYFRTHFAASATTTLSNLALRVCFNDGVAVYLNGTEILRRNLIVGAGFDDLATASNTEREQYWFSFPVRPTLLHTGTNTLAVELHRFAPDGPSLNFDLQLLEGNVD